MKHKPKVLFLIPALDTGGAEKVLKTLINNISTQHFTITVCTVTGKGHFYEGLTKEVTKVCLGASRVRNSAFKIYKYIKQAQPDLVFVFDVNNLNLIVGLVSFFLPSSIKYLTREVVILSAFINSYNQFTRLRKALYKWILKRFDLIVCQSIYMRDDLVRHFGVPEIRTIVIGNPIETTHIRQLATLSNFGFDKDKFNIVAVGRVVYVKGFDLLVEAMSFVKNPSVRLYIIGDKTLESPGYYEEVVKSIEVNKLENKISILGFQKNPYQYIQQSDLLALTSRTEGFPNVTLEAIALGTPVLAFNCPGGVSEIVEDGINGWLIENGNSRAFATFIDQLSLGQKRTPKISTDALGKYDISNIVPKYEELIFSVLKV